MSHNLRSPLELPLQGSALIEASAGTGKTYTIAAQYVRFILAHIESKGAAPLRSEPLLPPQILVVTFTKAATAELKERIRQRLVDAADWFRQPPDRQSGDVVIDGLREQYAPEQWSACAYALQTASEWMDEASVKTIHSWCQSVLREHAFSSGSLFAQTLSTDLEHIRLDAARDYWRSFIYPLSADALQAVRSVAATPHALMARVNKVWAQPVSAGLAGSMPAGFRSTDLAIEQWVAEAQARYAENLLVQHRAWQQHLPRWYVLIDQGEQRGLFNKPRTINSKKSRKDFAGIEQWLQLDAADALKEPPALSKALLDNYGPAKFPSLYEGELPPMDLLNALADLQAAIKRKVDISQPLLDHARQWIKQRFSDQLHQQALMGFDDIIEQTRRALLGEHGDTLSEVLRSQYPVAMIDEFQDTDPDQYAIFNAVYDIAQSRDDTSVCLIGDPKQAIYAFRGADIFTYLQARRDTQGRHYTLSTNFRSTQAMVSAVNGIFLPAESEQAGQAFLFDNRQGQPVPYIAAQARGHVGKLVFGPELAPDAEPKALTLWMAQLSDPEQQGSDNKPLSKEAYRELYAQHCAGYITDLLNSARAERTGIEQPNGEFTPLQSKDIAILVSTHQEGHLIQNALRERGIASVYLSDRNSVYDSAIAEDLYRVLLACASPGERTLVQNALYTHLLAQPLAELERLQHDDLAWDRQVEQFFELSAVWQTQGVLAMMYRLADMFAIAARLLSDVGGERLLTDYLHLAELLQTAATTLDGEQALLRYLHEQIFQREVSSHKVNAQPADEQIVRLESDAELIQIVTVHKSKGLEYPLVFLPFASLCRPVKASDEVFFYHDDNGQRQQALNADSTVLALADQERLAEDVRKLYVALTRARYACWVGVAPAGDWAQSAIAHLAGCFGAENPQLFSQAVSETWASHPCIQLGTVSQSHQREKSPQREKSLQQQLKVQDDDSATEIKVCRMPAGHSFTPWWIASYSALKYGALREPQSALESTLLESTLLEQSLPTQEVAETVEPAAPPVGHHQATLHDLPRGAGPGTFLHNLLEDAATIGFAKVAEQPDVRSALVEKRCRHGQWKARCEQLDQWLGAYLKQPFPLPGNKSSGGRGQVALADLHRYKAEPEFWLSVSGVSAERIDALVAASVMPQYPRPGLQGNYLNGMLKGFMDLVFEHDGQYFIVDYKSNYLGADDSAYTVAAMRDNILSSRYDMQYVLYTLALHKLLKNRLGDKYDYEQHIGGVVYLFLRGYSAPGAGAFTDKPPRALIEQLDALFMIKGAENSNIYGEQA